MYGCRGACGCPSRGFACPLVDSCNDPHRSVSLSQYGPTQVASSARVNHGGECTRCMWLFSSLLLAYKVLGCWQVRCVRELVHRSMFGPSQQKSPVQACDFCSMTDDHRRLRHVTPTSRHLKPYLGDQITTAQVHVGDLHHHQLWQDGCIGEQRLLESSMINK